MLSGETETGEEVVTWWTPDVSKGWAAITTVNTLIMPGACLLIDQTNGDPFPPVLWFITGMYNWSQVYNGYTRGEIREQTTTVELIPNQQEQTKLLHQE